VITKGLRTTRHEARQRWGCSRCGHTFTNQVTKHSPYPVKVIMEAIGRYNLASITGRDFPPHLFTPDEIHRSSNYPVRLSADVTRKENYAVKLAGLALQIAPSNKKRHETLQRFMLLNDSATIGVEVPIYLLLFVHILGTLRFAEEFQIGLPLSDLDEMRHLVPPLFSIPPAIRW
jgi:hypothetical protein